VRDLSSKFPSFWSGKVKWMLSVICFSCDLTFLGGQYKGLNSEPHAW
jgi:hypothetical protein